MAKSSASKRKVKNGRKDGVIATPDSVKNGALNTSRDQTATKKKSNFAVRTLWSLIMIAFFFAVLGSGYWMSILLIVGCQIAIFKECIDVTTVSSQEKNLPLTRTLNWYFLFTTMYYLEGKTLFIYFQSKIMEDTVLTFIVTHHRFLCYCLYLMGFVIFVCSLRKGHLKFQFASLSITHMVLLFVVSQAYLVTKNVLNGLFWFLLPCGLVIVNDIFAYLCGITLGRTKLIEISPKKTLEGFLGAWFFTALASIILTRLLSPYAYLTCPVKDLRTNFFTPLTCETNSVFIPQNYVLPPVLFARFGMKTIVIKPIYFHALNLATFASLFAPFGGFFASGLKRTFKVKDFGHSIPGHGGITDRVDCQIIMGSFTNLYFTTFISDKSVTPETVLTSVLLNFNDAQIMELILSLVNVLFKRKFISESASLTLTELLTTAQESLAA